MADGEVSEQAWQDEDLPAWSLPATGAEQIRFASPLPPVLDRKWAFAGSTGEGVRVCVLDSGIEEDHPRVGELQGAVAVSLDDSGAAIVRPDDEGDTSGHGTACASIIRAIAPGCELHSCRVVSGGFKGSGSVLLAGLAWAIEQRFDVINLSLSTTKKELAAALHELADAAYFQRTIVVASAHNLPIESFPWRFSSVISVGSHEQPDPMILYYNPAPPVEFYARGVDVDVAWLGGTTVRSTGNSFATPHVSGLCALVLSKHPELTPFQLKSVLALIADNTE
jgi:subtilisin